MAKYVIHKKGFFYDDQGLTSPEGAKGSVLSIFENLETAKIEKTQQDIISIKRLQGANIVDLFFYSKTYDQVYQKLEEYYKSELGIILTDKYYFEIPMEITDEQAIFFLKTLEISFHDIVEYSENDDLIKKDDNFEEQELVEI